MPGKPKDYKGHVVGEVTVIEKLKITKDPTWPVSWKHREIWKCVCSCGKEFMTPPSLLSATSHKSCGCKKKKLPEISDTFTKAQKASVRGLYNRTKNHANHSKRKWNIDINSFEKLISSTCHYCFQKPYKIFNVYINGKGKFRDKHKKEGAEAAYIKVQGLDRIDSNGDYTLDNVVSCCMTCNFAKHIKSYDEFISWLKMIAKVWKDKV